VAIKLQRNRPLTADTSWVEELPRLKKWQSCFQASSVGRPQLSELDMRIGKLRDSYCDMSIFVLKE